MFGVIRVPSPAPPLYRETSLNPRSSARMRIMFGFLSFSGNSGSDGPSGHTTSLYSATGCVNFIIFGIAHTTTSTRLIHSVIARRINNTKPKKIFFNINLYRLF